MLLFLSINFNQFELTEYKASIVHDNNNTHPQDQRGGLIDKPGKSRDYYHTCYTLSGLSIAQYIHNQETKILGPSSNLLVATHPVYNVGVSAVLDIKEYFQNVPVPVISNS